LFNYPENCLSWLGFLCAEDNENPLKKVFFNDHYTTASLMFALQDFFKKLQEIGNGKKGADKIVISDRNGKPANIRQEGKSFSLLDSPKKRPVRFLEFLSELTGWSFDDSKWLFENFSVYQFTKGTIKPNGRNFDELIRKNPLSWAMISGLNIEYTLEEPDTMPTLYY
jgi:hypothetical protein